MTMESPRDSRPPSSLGFTLNLDAFPQDSSVFLGQTTNQDRIDVIETDDIDGPTDFTQNMEHWMSLHELPGKTPVENHVTATTGFHQTDSQGMQDVHDVDDTDDVDDLGSVGSLPSSVVLPESPVASGVVVVVPEAIPLNLDETNTIRTDYIDGLVESTQDLTELNIEKVSASTAANEATTTAAAAATEATEATPLLEQILPSPPRSRSQSTEKDHSVLEARLLSLESRLSEANKTISALRKDLESSVLAVRTVSETLAKERKESVLAVERLQAQTTRHSAEITRHDDEQDDQIRKLTQKHDKQMSDVMEKAENLIRSVGARSKKEKAECKRLREELAQEREKTMGKAGELQDVQNELLLVNDRADDMERERDALKSQPNDDVSRAQTEEAQKSKAALEAAQSEIRALKDDFRIINDNIDTQVMEILKSRELSWKKRLEAAIADKSVMSKALLHEWGKSDVGLGDPQAYRYKYVERLK